MCAFSTVLDYQGSVLTRDHHRTSSSLHSPAHWLLLTKLCRAEMQMCTERYPCQAVKGMLCVLEITLNEFHLIWQNISGGVLGWGNADSSIIIWKKKSLLSRSQISNRQMQYAYIWQDQDYVPDYKDQKSQMVKVEQVLEKWFVLLLGLKSDHYACEDGTRLSSEGSPEKMSRRPTDYYFAKFVCAWCSIKACQSSRSEWLPKQLSSTHVQNNLDDFSGFVVWLAF